jgi:dihydroorotate dehydrogenase
MIRQWILKLSDWGYQKIVKPRLFQQSAQKSHDELLRWLSVADNSKTLMMLASWLNALTMHKRRITIGGTTLHYPFILAAGFVKGLGFENEEKARYAVKCGMNIIPGWQCVPVLLGAVEFGSFTRYPRLGNQGEVIWRNTKTQSTQNRIGLKNAGSVASAEFLCANKKKLPPIFGINIAPSPGVTDEAQETREVIESIEAFLSRGVVPTWFTLNLSCPNTEDDPTGNQTEHKTRHLCKAVVDFLQSYPYHMPLWVKISPNLAPKQYQILMRVFTEVGVKAVIATNTLPQPSPNQPNINAGVGGGFLHPHALNAAEQLQKARFEINSHVDVIGCGGVMDGISYTRYKALGIYVVQYWSALVFRGILAPQLIESESND